MTDAEIAASVGATAAAWLRTCPGQPLVLRSTPDGVEARIGLADRGARIGAADAADLLGVSRSAFYRNHFFGLSRGPDGRFSRLAVDRYKQRRAL
jgi:hypothetical protein